ncbi:MAG TPA: MarR family transcriptional regulator [Candidatus Pacearchaeota archaeon]|nr:marR family protein [archaeon BMS3Abin17]HDK41997.1 MarR family transcriptional regulator [Candidatus Pacearchaeota archaeon]HDZ60345.1 MarR family transcriptional regulator [Candidatus Pacearchaeota archaeon]
MENRNVGWLIIGIAVIMAIIVLIFNSALKNIAGKGCANANCTMYQAFSVQTGISLSIVAVVLVIGLVIMFTKPKERIIVKTIKEKKKKLDLSGLDKDDKKVVDLLLEENKAMFQSDLMEKLNIGKVKTTRLLNRLEDKGLIERKRRGMNNIVVLRD